MPHRAGAFEQRLDASCAENLEAQLQETLAKHIGFSVHCTLDEFEGFIAAYPEAEIIQLQVNYSDWKSPDFREHECIEIARAHGIPVIAMKPVKGGILAAPPQAVKDVLDEAMPDDPYATATLRCLRGGLSAESANPGVFRSHY